ncbi:MAG: CoA-disulfide reductase [Clostridiales bacterium]|nr:CoA-disulfide reductase [Clostridiales bacterium]
MKVIIIGGVAGGASAAARLRRNNEDAEIIVLERGEFISYANCGLPYYIGGTIKNKEDLTLQTPESFNARFNIDIRVQSEATKIDPDNKKITILDKKTGKSYEESYDKLMLSPGAEPIIPKIDGIDNDKVFTLRTIPDTYRIKEYIDRKAPRSAVVVGGGYIGIEMAENLHDAGVDVTIVELADHIIGAIDYDMACEVHNHIRDKGAKLILNDAVKAVEDGDPLTVRLTDSSIEADMVILAVGVRPDTDFVKSAGIEVNDRGSIIVNERMQTNIPDIYAAGDAVEVMEYVTKTKAFIPLAGPANKQGRIIADQICGIDSTYKGTQGTSILKCFDLTVACTGINERMAKSQGIDYEKSFTYSASHASYYPNATDMSIKLLFDKSDGRILGAQIVGRDGVDKRCDVIATAIRANMTVYDLTELELSYAPPYSSAKDPVNMAGYVAENILDNRVKVYHWHDVNSIDASMGTLLDVRTSEEYDYGTIEGYESIDLDELRRSIDKLDKSRPVYVTCQIGLRGYIACRMLTQHGFECYNLSGGYRLYHEIYHGDEDRILEVNIETQR